MRDDSGYVPNLPYDVTKSFLAMSGVLDVALALGQVAQAAGEIGLGTNACSAAEYAWNLYHEIKRLPLIIHNGTHIGSHPMDMSLARWNRILGDLLSDSDGVLRLVAADPRTSESDDLCATLKHLASKVTDLQMAIDSR